LTQVGGYHMNTSFPLFCYTAARSCPPPDTKIQRSQFLDSPADVTRYENKVGRQLRRELSTLGRPGKRALRRLHKRPSIECQILSFQ
jgi:hypothetical protein